MKDKIKEILEELDWYIKQPNNQDINGEYEPPMELAQEEAKDIYDCITNLQEIAEEINNICDDIIVNLNSEYLFDKKYIYDKVLLIQNIVRGVSKEDDN